MEKGHCWTSKTILVALTSVLALAPPASRADPAWWPSKVVEVNGSEQRPATYEALQHASKKWNICVLLPHMKDTSWVTADYGIIEHAKDLGLKVTVFEAGGYENLSRQVSQYDDCMALGADAIVLAAISEAGLAQKIEEGAKKKIVQVAMINPITSAPVNAGVFNDYKYKASVAAEAAKKLFAGQAQVNAIDLPGPAGSGWAEASAAGFDAVMAGSNIKVLETKYGDTGKVKQTQILEDAFQTYDKIDLIFGTGVAAESAPSTIKQMGLEGKVKVISWYATDAVWDGIANGTIQGAADEEIVMSGAIALDVAVKALEGKPYPKRILPPTFYADKAGLASVNWNKVRPPKDWKPVFNLQ